MIIMFKSNRRRIRLISIFLISILLINWMIISPYTIVYATSYSQAYSKGQNNNKAYLSDTEVKLFKNDKKKLSIKGLPDKVSSKKIKWKTSNKNIVSISKKYGRKITIKAKRTGKARITAIYKKKKYSCTVNVIKDSPVLNSTDVSIHKISDYAVPVVGKNPVYNYSFQFEVSGTKAKVSDWTLEGDKKNVKRFILTDEGKISMLFGHGYDVDYSECTVVAHLSDGRRLKANVKGYDDDGIYVKNKIEEFKRLYITDQMSEYEKMEKVAWYLSAEYDYELNQPDWTRYIITGSGDCMASRVAVMYFCRELGLHACYCPDVDAHGDTVVRADGKVYLVTTGFKEKKPRTYWINEMSRELFDKRNAKNHISVEYIWGND